jgi:hypothetical protein
MMSLVEVLGPRLSKLNLALFRRTDLDDATIGSDDDDIQEEDEPQVLYLYCAIYRAFHGFETAKFAYGVTFLGSGQFSLLPQLPASKNDSQFKISQNSSHRNKGPLFVYFHFRSRNWMLFLIACRMSKTFSYHLGPRMSMFRPKRKMPTKSSTKI